MATRRKTGGRDFKPGKEWTGNPKGRPVIPTDHRLALELVRQLRGNARALIATFYHELIELTHDDLQRMVGYKIKTKKGEQIVPPAPGTPVLKLLLARSLLYAMRSGKAFELSVHSDLMCGPEPKQVNLGDANGEPLGFLAKYNQPQLAALVASLDDIVKESECKSTPNSPPSSASPAPLLPRPSGTES